MNKNNKLARLNALFNVSPIGGLDHRHVVNKDGKLPFLESMSRNERRQNKKFSKRLSAQYHKLMIGISKSGCGFPVDQALREFAIEYNHRYASSGIYNQPVSFNYIEPFCSIELLFDCAPCVKLVAEENHVFQLIDFFDYYTNPAHEQFDLSELIELAENKTYHFSTSGNVLDFRFLAPSGNEFVISGFSIVRRGDSIHWYLLGGEILAENEWEKLAKNPEKIEQEDIAPWKRAFLKEGIEETGATHGAPRALETTELAVRTLLAGEIDLKTKKHLGRCHMTEYEHAFMIRNDDPDVFLGINDEREKESIKNMMDYIESASVLWDLADALFELPVYFQKRYEIAKQTVEKSGKAPPIANKGGRGLNANYIVVPALGIVDGETSAVPIRSLSLPHYEIETEGHWRRLQPGQIGKDRNGVPVSGKTWVNKQSPWRKRPTHERVVYAKDSLSIAKEKVEQILSEVELQEETPKSNTSTNHVLYVLRCAVMNEEVYKIGWTRKSARERAVELSRETGVPDSFLVVCAWHHMDAQALEKDVHMMLAPYRINERREFFRVNLQTIKNTVESVIQRAAG